MSDLVDAANDLAETERTAALERHRNRHAAEAKPHSAMECIDCGEPIPPKRLKAHPHAVRCIEHARAHEQRLRHYRRA